MPPILNVQSVTKQFGAQPLAPAARERGCLGGKVGEAGPARQLAQPAFTFVFVDMRGGQRPFQNLTDGKAGSKARVLGHIGGAGALAHRQLARVRFELAGKNGQQRGFARAVGTDEADPVAVLHGQGDVLEERLGAELFGHRLRIENWRHLFQNTLS